jgi:hypothetical protein
MAATVSGDTHFDLNWNRPSLVNFYSVHEDDCFTGRCVVLSGRSVPTFQRCLLPFTIRAMMTMALITEAIGTSETSVSFYETTCSNISEDKHLHVRRPKNLKSHLSVDIFLQLHDSVSAVRITTQHSSSRIRKQNTAYSAVAVSAQAQQHAKVLYIPFVQRTNDLDTGQVNSYGNIDETYCSALHCLLSRLQNNVAVTVS